MTAPPSCRAESNAAPAACNALVTAKLPLPTRPKNTSTPRSASARPIASETCIADHLPRHPGTSGYHGAFQTDVARFEHAWQRSNSLRIGNLEKPVTPVLSPPSCPVAQNTRRKLRIIRVLVQ